MFPKLLTTSIPALQRSKLSIPNLRMAAHLQANVPHTMAPRQTILESRLTDWSRIEFRGGGGAAETKCGVQIPDF